MNLSALIGSQILAIEPAAKATLEAKLSSVMALMGKGIQPTTASLSPAELPDVVYNGGNPLVPEIVGSEATLEVFGDLIARAPWWAKAYMGVIDHFDLADAIDALATNSAISSLVIEIDTCGGTCTGCSEITAAMWRFQGAGKTITVRAAGTLASAGYWIASQADRIEATPTTRVGSLGTMAVLMDSTVADAAAGVKFEVISSGPEKGMGFDGAITPQLRAATQTMIDQLTALFRDQVATARQMPDIAALFTGQVWIAGEALTLGLIDAVISPADELGQATGNTPAPIAVPPPIEDSNMDAKALAALTELSAKHPTHAAALVAAANLPGASADSLKSALHQAEAVASAEQTKQQLTAITAEAATTKAALEAEKTAHAATKDALSKATAISGKLGGIAATAGTDPGGDAHGAEVPDEAKWRAEFAASAELQNNFYAGANSYVAHKRDELESKNRTR